MRPDEGARQGLSSHVVLLRSNLTENFLELFFFTANLPSGADARTAPLMRSFLELSPASGLRGHGGAVQVAVFNASGSHCVSGGTDRVLNLWNPYRAPYEEDAQTGALIVQQYRGHAQDVTGVAIARDGAVFASVGGDRCAFVWDTERGEATRRVYGHDSRLGACALGGAGGASVLATGGDDMTLRLHDLRAPATRGPLQTLRGFRDKVTGVHLEEAAVLATCMDGTLRTWDLRAGAASEALGEAREALTAYSWGLEVAGLGAQLRTTLEESLLRTAEVLRRVEEEAAAAAPAGAGAGNALAASLPAPAPLAATTPASAAAPTPAADHGAAAAAAAAAAVTPRTPGDTRPAYPTMLDSTRRILGLKLPGERAPVLPAWREGAAAHGLGQQHRTPPGTARSASRRRSASPRSARAGEEASAAEAAANAAQAGHFDASRPASRGTLAPPSAQRLLSSPFLRASPRVKFVLSPEARAHARSLRPDWSASTAGRSAKELQAEDARLKLTAPVAAYFGGGEGESASARPSSRAGVGAGSSRSASSSRPGTREGGRGSGAGQRVGTLASAGSSGSSLGSPRRGHSSSSAAPHSSQGLGLSLYAAGAGAAAGAATAAGLSPSWLHSPKAGLEGPPSWVLGDSSMYSEFPSLAEPTPLRTEAEAFLQGLRGKLGGGGGAAGVSASASTGAPGT